MRIKKRWTTDEEEVLKKLYKDPSKKAREIADILGRNVNSIHGRASILGLTKVTFNDIEIPEGTKICRKCQQIINLEKFYKNSSKKGGYETYCIECSKELKNKQLLNKALKKVEKDEQDKKDFINENINKQFRCTACNEELNINDFSIFKKNNKYTRNNICKKCASKKAIEIHYDRLKKLGHK